MSYLEYIAWVFLLWLSAFVLGLEVASVVGGSRILLGILVVELSIWVGLLLWVSKRKQP